MCLGGGLASLLAGGYLPEHNLDRGEFFPLLVFSTVGAMALAASGDFLSFFVALEKGEFIGRSVLGEQKHHGVSKKCVAFKVAEKSPPPRPDYPIWSTGSSGEKIGRVVSGTQSPSLAIGIGMGYVPPEFAAPGTPIEIEVRGRRFPAAVVQKPIYRKS